MLTQVRGSVGISENMRISMEQEARSSAEPLLQLPACSSGRARILRSGGKHPGVPVEQCECARDAPAVEEFQKSTALEQVHLDSHIHIDPTHIQFCVVRPPRPQQVYRVIGRFFRQNN